MLSSAVVVGVTLFFVMNSSVEHLKNAKPKSQKSERVGEKKARTKQNKTKHTGNDVNEEE